MAARITQVHHRLDIHTLGHLPAERLECNEIGGVTVQLQQKLPLLPFGTSRVAGSAILVDPSTHRTSGALLTLAS